MFAAMRIRSCSVLSRAVTARRGSSRSVVRGAFAAEPLQPSIQLSPALRMLKTSLIPLMTPLERSESWEVQQQAFHQRIKREKALIAERERGTPHWTSFYHRCLAERPILTKVRMAAMMHALRRGAVRFPAAHCTCQPHASALVLPPLGDGYTRQRVTVSTSRSRPRPRPRLCPISDVHQHRPCPST